MDNKLKDSNYLALDRTWLAHERTLMAWVRTATPMIGFSFSIYKFFELDTQASRFSERSVLSPRVFSILMTATALVALFPALLSNFKEMQRMRHELDRGYSIANVLAVLILTIGSLALLAAVAND